MDTLSHGFWSYLFFFNHRKRYWAFVIGVAPDIIAFVPHVFAEHFQGGQILFDMLYRFTHSLIVFAFVFCVISLMTRSVPWVWSAWGVHIVFDIFTHPQAYYPAPFLYPFESPFWFALDYRTPWFYAINYAILIGIGAMIFVARRFYRSR